MSWEAGRPEGRERNGNGWSVEQSEHPPHLLIKFSVLYWCGSWLLETVAVVTSMVTELRSLQQI